MKISDLTKETKELTVVYRTPSAEFEVKLEYRTQAVDVGFIQEMRAKDGIDRVVYQVVEVVSKWDLQFDDGKLVPVTAEGIEKAHIPVFLLHSILDAIAEDQRLLPDDSKNG